MKNFKIKKYQLFIVLFTLVFSSCENNGDPDLLFEDTPTVRIEKTIEELKETLQDSENGWKAAYFTDNTTIGGYTFLFDFISNSEVRMNSDFGTPDPSAISLYTVTLGSTVKLSFTTKNIIHDLSDPTIYPFSDWSGQGYKGSFEFLYVGKEGEDLIFKSNRDRTSILRFTKATEEEWVSLPSESKSMLKNNISKDPSKPIFRNLVLENNGETTLYSFSLNENLRFASVITDSDDAEKKDISFGIAPNPKGFKISPAVEIDGVTLEDFVFNEENSEFVAEVNETKLTLRYEDELNFLLPSYDFGSEPNGNNSLRLYSTYSNTNDDSQAFTAFMDGFKQHFIDTQRNRTIYRIYLYDLDTDDPYLQIRFISNSGKEWKLNYDISYTLSEDAIGNMIVNFTEDIPVNTDRRDGSLPFIEFLTRDSGFYVQKRADRSDTSNTIGLIAVDDFTLLCHWYDL